MNLGAFKDGVIESWNTLNLFSYLLQSIFNCFLGIKENIHDKKEMVLAMSQIIHFNSDISPEFYNQCFPNKNLRFLNIDRNWASLCLHTMLKLAVKASICLIYDATGSWQSVNKLRKRRSKSGKGLFFQFHERNCFFSLVW